MHSEIHKSAWTSQVPVGLAAFEKGEKLPPRECLPSRLVIIGAGGHGKVVADVAITAGFYIVGFVDDKAVSSPLPGFQILGRVHDIPSLVSQFGKIEIAIAIGENATRKRIAESINALGVPFARIIHPSSIVSRFAQIGEGTVVMPGVVVNAGAAIGKHVILNTACSVDHDCVIGDFAHISPGAHLAGSVTVEEGVHVGTGASIIPGCSVGSWSIVGAGAIVIRNISSHVVAVGVPAKEIRSL